MSKASAAKVAANGPDISRLADCTEDARLAALETDLGPADPTDYDSLLSRLVASRARMPPLYRDAAFEPFLKTVQDLGPKGFMQALLNPRVAGPLIDTAHAIIQNGERYLDRATDGFEEVVSDLFDGFLSAEDRRGISPPDKGAIAPLVKRGQPSFGPYTWPIAAMSSLGVKCSIVSLPPANARRGILAWAALPHETAGHNILSADTGLKSELIHEVQSALTAAQLPDGVAEYWSSRIDETASDVMGILNIGPAAGIGLIGYFRGLVAGSSGLARLRSDGPASDSHPADVLRGFLAASTVARLKFKGATGWARAILDETVKDVTKITVDGVVLSSAHARESAEIVAATIGDAKLENLDGHALSEVQNWRDADEEIAGALVRVLTTSAPLPSTVESGAYAAHVVAAAVYAVLSGSGGIAQVFDRMLGVLKQMHDVNASWGPPYVSQPGSLMSHRAYVPA